MFLAVEIGDWYRVSGNSIESFGGHPDRDSSGESKVRGSITKTCNIHALADCWSWPPGITDAATE